jgi:hypothetical protein
MAEYTERLSSDNPDFGGSAFQTKNLVHAEPTPYHGYPQSVSLHLPPLGALILVPGAEEEEAASVSTVVAAPRA